MCRRVLHGEPDVLFMISLICRSVVYGDADVAGMVNQLAEERAGRMEESEAARADKAAALEAARADKQAAHASHEEDNASLIGQLAASTAQVAELMGLVSVVHREPDL